MFLVGEEMDVPMNIDWEHSRVFKKTLKVFYDETLSIFGSLHVTINTFSKSCATFINHYINGQIVRMMY